MKKIFYVNDAVLVKLSVMNVDESGNSSMAVVPLVDFELDYLTAIECSGEKIYFAYIPDLTKEKLSHTDQLMYISDLVKTRIVTKVSDPEVDIVFILLDANICRSKIGYETKSFCSAYLQSKIPVRIKEVPTDTFITLKKYIKLR